MVGGSIPPAGTISPPMRLIRVVAPHFVAGFETDGIVRRAAPILRYMVGWTDGHARVYIANAGWSAHEVRPVSSVVERLICNEDVGGLIPPPGSNTPP